jgi:hypothetical protein
VTTTSNRSHRARLRQREHFAKLEPCQQEARLESSRSAEGWCLDLTFESDKGLDRSGHAP